jgi:hypothetical protein
VVEDVVEQIHKKGDEKLRDGEEDDARAHNRSKHRYDNRRDAGVRGLAGLTRSHDAEEKRDREKCPPTARDASIHARTKPMTLSVSAISPSVFFRLGDCGPDDCGQCAGGGEDGGEKTAEERTMSERQRFHHTEI